MNKLTETEIILSCHHVSCNGLKTRVHLKMVRSCWLCVQQFRWSIAIGQWHLSVGPVSFTSTCKTIVPGVVEAYVEARRCTDHFSRTASIGYRLALRTFQWASRHSKGKFVQTYRISIFNRNSFFQSYQVPVHRFIPQQRDWAHYFQNVVQNINSPLTVWLENVWRDIT